MDDQGWDSRRVTLAAAQSVLQRQPFSAPLDARLEALEGGYAVLELTADTRMLQQFRHVHGGVLSYLADNAHRRLDAAPRQGLKAQRMKHDSHCSSDH